MRPRTRIVLLSLLTILVVAFALAVLLDRPTAHSPGSTPTRLPANTPSASGFDGAALPPHVRARDFTLTSLSAPTGQPGGGPVSLSSYRGQVVVLAFLYSTCGATCTLIAQQIRGALDELGGHSSVVLIVSADPGADTPSRARGFLAQVSLTGRVHYLTGPSAQLRAMWHAYGVTPASTGRAAFDATAAVYLIDPSGDERVVFGVEQLTPEGLAHDIGKLRTKS